MGRTDLSANPFLLTKRQEAKGERAAEIVTIGNKK
jgi:hypothetical protein